MGRESHLKALVCVSVLALAVSQAPADVFNMGGTRNPDGSWNGLASLETVPVGNVGNAPDPRHGAYNFGQVDYPYSIGKYEVTAGQYCEFLNAVARTDMYGLYNPSMWSDSSGCKIQRANAPGSYTYNVASDWANRPVNFVSFLDGCRFANWVHNGQPAGDQEVGSTETGAYTLDGNSVTIARNSGWRWAVTNWNEWYKAAYHKNDGLAGDYWSYPTSGETLPSNDFIDPDPGNSANFYDDAGTYTIGDPYWRTQVGEFENSGSPYGTFDQGGNIREWTERATPNSLRFTLGGGFSIPGFYLSATEGLSNAVPPMAEISSIGLRVVAVPEPGTLTLIVAALAGLVRRRHT
ncbi:MAG: SUMF1/EgtB/PvdO family nonheme iron enzyme [Phycisphaerae bacterium]|nr:SUMF1/EgtB/PvdO family nonheme iron enzyme [Phycisphaerae bacterium]